MEAFTALFGDAGRPTDLTVSWARFFRLGEPDALLRDGLAATACHDWGKANDGFQAMLLREGTQLLRHEQISALLILWPSVWSWLGTNPALDREVILAAVAGHHLKARAGLFGQPQADSNTLLRVHWDHPDLRRNLVDVAATLGLSGHVPDDVPRLWSFEPRPGLGDLDAALNEVRRRLGRFGDAIEHDEPRRRRLWAIRAALIAADAAGSGLIREGRPIDQWIAQAFAAAGRLDASRIDESILRPRRDEIGDRWRGWNPFQAACGDVGLVPERALLLAPCGSGKTLAAWRWIQARCAERPRGRAIFLYPTRGTATEGFRDYVAAAGPEAAALVHGTADLDLDAESRVQEARLFALRQWPRRLFSATVDQFLGFLQHAYGPTCALPLLADAVVVLDEVHSYDRGMFSALLQFLDEVDVPVLAMTATLLDRRKAELGKRLTIVNGLDLDGMAALGSASNRLREIAEYDRYDVTLAPSEAAAEEIVRERLAAGDRVLWVVNVVDRAQAIARRFAGRMSPDADRLTTTDSVPLHCYHSRFRLQDRKDRHQAVVAAFRRHADHTGPVLAITTQVCEMSLDLDADLLVSEVAPASSLVQRMGRCCRDPDADRASPPRAGRVVLYRPDTDSSLPYSAQDLAGVDGFVERLVARRLASQSDLEDLLTDIAQPAELPRECRFFHSGPWAAAGEENFREIDAASRQALLPSDVEEYLRRAAGPARWRADGLILPVPRGSIDPAPDPRLPGWLRVAQGGVYRPTLGFCTADRPAPIIA
jgi:CRISPR-associated endonuclease/helicase Cas3